MGQKRGVYDRKTDIASLNAYGTYLLLDICEAVVRGSRSETLFTEGKYRFYFRHICEESNSFLPLFFERPKSGRLWMERR